jgi:hypothetical protein
VLLQKKKAQGQKKGKEIVQTAANTIEAINNEATAGESVANKARTSSPIAVREQTSFIITTKRPVTISLKDNTNIARVKRQGTKINANNIIA